MLEEIVKFLNKNNIKYYIFAGTLLGAVRHKGFIPWDDDIDLCIPRSDYDKLIDILKQNKCKIKENLEAIGYEVGKDTWPFIKVVNKNIKVSCLVNHDEYLWIDIFPLDNIPNKSNNYFRKIHLSRILYQNKFEDENKYYSNNDSKLKKIVKRIVRIVLRIFSKESIIKKHIKNCKKYNNKNCDYVYINVWGDSDNNKIKKSELVDCTYEFEGLKVNGMKDYDSILTRQYGNYMELPPVEKRATHNFKAWRVEDDNKENEE